MASKSASTALRMSIASHACVRTDAVRGDVRPSAACRHALECRRAAPRSPRRDQPCHIALVRLGCINGEIVLREAMHGVKVRASLSGAPVTPAPFPTLQLWQRTVYPDKEHVKWRQQLDQIGQPPLLLNDV